MLISILPKEFRSFISSAKFRGPPGAPPSSVTSVRTALNSRADTKCSMSTKDWQGVNPFQSRKSCRGYSEASFSFSSNCCFNCCFASLRTCRSAENLHQTTKQTLTAVNISHKPPFYILVRKPKCNVTDFKPCQSDLHLYGAQKLLLCFLCMPQEQVFLSQTLKIIHAIVVIHTLDCIAEAHSNMGYLTSPTKQCYLRTNLLNYFVLELQLWLSFFNCPLITHVVRNQQVPWRCLDKQWKYFYWSPDGRPMQVSFMQELYILMSVINL